MRTQNDTLSIATYAFALLTAGCAASHAVDEDRIFGDAVEPQSGAAFEVEVRYAGGATREQAETLLAGLEIVNARELYPDLDLSRIPDDAYDQDEALDASEPTFEVVLHPQNEPASKERFAWRATADLEASVDAPPQEAAPATQVAAARQALTLDGSIHKTLEAGASWRTARMRCYAPFVFGADLLGLANVCVDLGYDGVAGSVCTAGYDPREPIIVVHPGPDLNPLNKHYFRGRVTAKAYGISLPAEILAAGWACL